MSGPPHGRKERQHVGDGRFMQWLPDLIGHKRSELPGVAGERLDSAVQPLDATAKVGPRIA
ncbi:MAG: hypothetical protein DWH93_00290 [Planctomycetota bacterium]|nr:MAG: hypothetical protein DWH93_00290 [Planctomycetota bacterium]